MANMKSKAKNIITAGATLSTLLGGTPEDADAGRVIGPDPQFDAEKEMRRNVLQNMYDECQQEDKKAECINRWYKPIVLQHLLEQLDKPKTPRAPVPDAECTGPVNLRVFVKDITQPAGQEEVNAILEALSSNGVFEFVGRLYHTPEMAQPVVDKMEADLNEFYAQAGVQFQVIEHGALPVDITAPTPENTIDIFYLDVESFVMDYVGTLDKMHAFMEKSLDMNEREMQAFNNIRQSFEGMRKDMLAEQGDTVPYRIAMEIAESQICYQMFSGLLNSATGYADAQARKVFLLPNTGDEHIVFGTNLELAMKNIEAEGLDVSTREMLKAVYQESTYILLDYFTDVAGHEIGHVLGLEHYSQNCEMPDGKTKLMCADGNGFYGVGNLETSGLTPEDLVQIEIGREELCK